MFRSALDSMRSMKSPGPLLNRAKSASSKSLTPTEARMAKNRLYGVNKMTEMQEFIVDNPDVLLSVHKTK